MIGVRRIGDTVECPPRFDGRWAWQIPYQLRRKCLEYLPKNATTLSMN